MTNTFQGKLIRLRAGEPADAIAFREWDREHPDDGRSLFEIMFPQPRLDPAKAAEELPKPQNDEFGFVIETLDGTLVGGLTTHHVRMRNGTFMYGIAILPEHRRKGYAHEAIWLVLRYYFYERRYQKCVAEVYGFNEASQRMHEQLGFTLEGRLRRMIYTNGAYHDSLFFGITYEEFCALDKEHQ